MITYERFFANGVNVEIQSVKYPVKKLNKASLPPQKKSLHNTKNKYFTKNSNSGVFIHYCGVKKGLQKVKELKKVK